jgi:hypothetical protein
MVGAIIIDGSIILRGHGLEATDMMFAILQKTDYLALHIEG